MSLSLPREYNAAVDFVDRHVAQGPLRPAARSSTTSARSPTASSQNVSPARGTPCSPWACSTSSASPCACTTRSTSRRVFWGAIKAGRGPGSAQHPAHDRRLRVHAEGQPGSRARRERRVAREAGTGRRRVSSPPPRREDERARGDCSRRLPLPSSPQPRAPTTSPSGSTRRARPGRRRARSTCTRTWSPPPCSTAPGVLGIREDDVVFSAAKLFFAYGLGNAMTFPLHVGATAVLMAERPTPCGRHADDEGAPADDLRRRSDALRLHPRRRLARSRRRLRPPPRQHLGGRGASRGTWASGGASASAPTSSTASARRRCSTSSSRTATATSATERAASPSPATT